VKENLPSFHSIKVLEDLSNTAPVNEKIKKAFGSILKEKKRSTKKHHSIRFTLENETISEENGRYDTGQS
jgi:hypothetical protein